MNLYKIIIRSHQWNKDRQYNGQKKKMASNDLLRIAQQKPHQNTVTYHAYWPPVVIRQTCIYSNRLIISSLV